MAEGPHARRHVVDGTPAPRERDQLLDRPHPERRMHHERIRGPTQKGDVGKIADWIERRIGAHGRRDRVIRNARSHQGIAVRLRMSGGCRPDQPAAAGPVVDDQGLVQQRRQELREQPGKRVGRPARGRGRDDPYGPRRPFGGGGGRDRDGEQGERSQPACCHRRDLKWQALVYNMAPPLPT